MQSAFLAQVHSGVLIGAEGHAAITFTLGEEAVSLALASDQLTALLTVCVGLSAEVAARAAPDAVQLLPVSDWQVGRTASQAVVVRFTSAGGASLSYGLARQQALELRDSLTLATAQPPREALHAPAIGERMLRPGAEALEPLRELRRDHQHEPATVELIDACVALLAELDAANDEGRATFRRNLLALVAAVTGHLRASEDALGLAADTEPAGGL
jgi:hypothetical protein